MLGLDPLPERTPLHATVTGSLEKSGVTIEKVHYQSKPGLYVTGNLYRPKASRERKRPEKGYPAILYVCGHSGRGRDGNKTAFQDHGLWFAVNGYVCLVVDTLQLGEIAGMHHGTYREGRWWWHDRGYTPAGVECWNGIRGIDYLVSRPDVDAEKIGVTGISGGGATTVWMAAADDRVKVAVPVSRHERSRELRDGQGHQRPLRLHVRPQHLPMGMDDHPRALRAEAAAVRQQRQRLDLPDGRQPPHRRPSCASATRCSAEGELRRLRLDGRATTTAPTCAWRSSPSSRST